MSGQTGTVFDIKEFAVFDGPGIRTTVFMKGCPLSCMWCHNPEGLSPKPQLMVSRAACTHCGACERICRHPDGCVACGECVPVCPGNFRKIAGQRWEAEALAARLRKDADVYEMSGGGVTFSGGEPLMQWPFVKDVIAHLDGVHCAVETSGFVSDEVFGEVMSTFNLIMMDIKLTDSARHKHFTGVDNAPILRHADMLREGNTPFIIRMPLIPGVNDEPAHFEAVAARIEGARALQRVEFLPYHKTAGAKYSLVGMKYSPEFDVNRPVQIDPEPFNKRGIPVVTL